MRAAQVAGWIPAVVAGSVNHVLRRKEDRGQLFSPNAFPNIGVAVTQNRIQY